METKIDNEQAYARLFNNRQRIADVKIEMSPVFPSQSQKENITAIYNSCEQLIKQP